MARIYTIGYEGASSDQVFRALEEAGADSLIDVRADAGIRKEFQREALQAESDRRDLYYFFYPSMGVGFQQRAEVKSGKRELAEVYSQVLSYANSQAFLTWHKNAIESGRRICLLCFERDAARCHRKLLAEALQKLVPGSEIVHLAPAGAGQ